MNIFKKRGSLELSVNAIVVIVIAITMLGLGLGFLRGIFSGSLGKVEAQLKQLEEQNIKAFLDDCESPLCLQTRKVDINKNEKYDMWIGINNKFDCDLNGISIKIGNVQGGSKTFSNNACRMIETDNSNCADIQIQTTKTKDVKQKTKEAVLVRIQAKSSAKPTVYDYDIEVKGSCQYAGSTFTLDEKMTLTINVKS